MSDNDLIRRVDALGAVQEWTYCCDAGAAIAAIPAVQPIVEQQVAGNGFTIKPLVWRSNGKGRVCADTPFGIYEIEHGGYGMRLLHGGSFMQDDLQGIEAAKAAAQADYEARILSALDMQPTMKPDVAALAEAREKALREAADELRGQGYNTAVRTILALIEKEE